MKLIKKRIPKRKGAAIVEFAVMLPLIVLLVLGSIEFSAMIFAKQAMVQCAYQAAIMASKVGGKTADAVDAAERVAQGRRINNVSVVFNPPNIESLPSGTIVTVTAEATANSNRYISSNFLGIDRISAQATMVKECP